MRAVVCPELGPPEILEFKEIDPPEMGDDDVKVAVKAAGVNFADILRVKGTYQDKIEPPFVPGLELSGVVEACGTNVINVQPGDRICAAPMRGAFAETAVFAAAEAHRIPDSMDFETAAAFPVAYGTSHLALEDRAALQTGETLLVLGAGSGVGLTAVEIGKHLGATVIAVAGDEKRLAAAAAQGADHVLDHRGTDIRDAVKSLTDGRGADVVYDPVGGELGETAFRATAYAARILVVGFASGGIPVFPANIVLVKNISILGYVWGSYFRTDPGIIHRGMDRLLEWVGDGTLKPAQPEVMKLEDATAALTAHAERRVTGKIVLKTG